MKLNFKKIFLFLIILIIVIITAIVITKKNNKFERPNYDYVGTIYHSEKMGIDAGLEYIYYIYTMNNSKNRTYFYIKSKSQITIAGSSEETDIDSGGLMTKSDIKKIKKDILKDSNKDCQQYISYTYVNNGVNEELQSIEELASKLFY